MSQNAQSGPIEAVSLGDSRWIWVEVLTSAALTGLCVAAVFNTI
jgi:hypothetical protein